MPIRRTKPATAPLTPAITPATPTAGRTSSLTAVRSPDVGDHVAQRADVSVDRDVLHVKEDAAIKHNTFPSRPGYPSGMAHWQTHLHVEAWVRNVTYAKQVWADVHVFAHDGALIARHTRPFGYERPAGDGGDVFQLEHVVYEGATATPGSATPRPDVRLVQYRLYCELDGRVYTDGLLHDCVLRADVASH